MRLIKAIFVVMLLLPPTIVEAAGPGHLLAHYTHQRWSEESDAPRPVFSLAQDRRGYLWVAAAGGLSRFDGIRFEPISAEIDPIANGPPSAILIRHNGEVWTNFERSGRFAVYRDGQLRFLRAPPAPHRVITMREAGDSTVWVLTERVGLPLMRYRNGGWTSFGTGAGAPLDNPYSMVVTGDGSVWVSFNDSVMRLPPGGHRLELVRHALGARGRLSLDPQERVWFTERNGSYPITGPGGQGRPPKLRHAYATDNAEIRGWPAFDREGNLWIATYYDGLQRVPHPDPRGAPSADQASAQVEHFTAHDGLSSNATTQIFQDREGNVWATTEDGVDKFWPATLHHEPELSRPAAFGDLLLEASDGTVYIGEASTVYRVRPGKQPEPIFRTNKEPRTLCEAPDGAIWISLFKDKQIVVWRNGSVRELAQRVPLSYTIYDCAFDANGDYWVTASFGGMARLHAGRWERMFGPTSDAFLPKSMITDLRGRMIVHWNDRSLIRFDGQQRRVVSIPFDGYAPDDVALYSAPSGSLYVAGRFGLARLGNGRLETILARRVPLFSDVNGMVQAPSGETWLASPGGVLRISTAALESAFRNPAQVPPMRVLGVIDGLTSPPHSHSRHAIVRGGDGRLWIAVQSGTMWLDPDHVAQNRSPPDVAVGALIADRLYRDPTRVTLPAGTSNIQIDFAVLSFSNPRTKHVRYRIEGQDSNWIAAGTRRQAFYTNLAPGSYRFRLIAANDNGIWNERGATLEFVIPPTFVQSSWFALLCGGLALFLLWLAYRFRMNQVARAIRSRLEERLGERERISRELHDTLLQSVQGLVLRFQSVANKMPAEGGARLRLEAVLKRADEVIAEGRDRVQNLRAVDGAGDLIELLKERGIAAEFDPAIPIRIVAEGKPRPLYPLVSIELGRIVDEALRNTARHARATAIDITIRFTRPHLDIEIRDDGMGIPPDVLKEGYKPGHFGLVGMRERTERIGGSFSLDSRSGMGCAVTIAIPARLAFADPAPHRWRLFSRLFGGRREAGDV
jgi:signal transduction histidine kinase/ligand-binding sensor domain-containing protein